jgi:HTH-type transcriptional regulator / antitoxin HigA
MTITTDSHTYVELLTAFPPRPIKSAEDLDAVQAVIDRLLDTPRLSPEQRDYLNVLGMLVQDYEMQHVPIPDISGVELLKVLIADRGLKQKDLVPIFKTESIVSAVLSGQRNLTVEHIEKLAAFFHISPAVFFPVCGSVYNYGTAQSEVE